MSIVIEPVANGNQAIIRRIRQRVFQHEMGIPLERLQLPPGAIAFHLLASVEPQGEPVAALTVLDTSGDDKLHARSGLCFEAGARVARYTQLAVLRPYRGLDLPLAMMLEARRRFVAPQGFDYTWLLFDADRASASSICNWLAYIPSPRSVPSEYGLSRALSRDERVAASQQANRRTESYINQAFQPLAAELPAALESV